MGLNKPGGPIIDPDNPLQTIKFAIIKKNRSIQIDNLLVQDFEQFIKSSKPPKSQYIGRGDDVVIYFSITANIRDLNNNYSYPSLPSWHGVLYSHGIYFAHDDELSDAFAIIGAKEPFFIPKRPAGNQKDGNDWVR
jgi:hypothetical protein